MGCLFLARLPPCQIYRGKLSASSVLWFLETAGGGERTLLNQRFCLPTCRAIATASGAIYHRTRGSKCGLCSSTAQTRQLRQTKHRGRTASDKSQCRDFPAFYESLSSGVSTPGGLRDVKASTVNVGRGIRWPAVQTECLTTKRRLVNKPSCVSSRNYYGVVKTSLVKRQVSAWRDAYEAFGRKSRL